MWTKGLGGVFVLLVVQGGLAMAPESSSRELERDYSYYEERYLEGQVEETSIASTPIRAARYFNEAGLPWATKWGSMSELRSRFERMRDLRFISRNSFLRRPSWLYPDDGCFARAALANRVLYRSHVPVPKKVFAFGNLRVRTRNSPRGRVGWWYHVAPIVEVQGVKYVLDPAIEPRYPLSLKNWLTRMGNPARIKVAICASGTYAPKSNCSQATDGTESRALRSQYKYLDLEWRRIISLGRRPEQELGGRPPWIRKPVQ